MSSDIQPLNSIGPMGQAGNPEKNDDPVQAEYEEGKRYLENSNLGQAAVMLHNALVGFEEKKDENGIANASNQLGHVCLAKEDYVTALTHYQRAFAICDKANDRMSVLAVLDKVAVAQKGLKKYDDAISTCLDILDQYQDNRDPQGAVSTLEKMAQIYLEKNDKHKAADTYRTIASIHRNFRHENIAADFVKKAEELDN
ncbi:tetratricopeptide repeat protein [Desulforhopalus singaporensis]|uniref:Tetratricopeptide repeat-containing protein n=1 Tax=Desulforhopalus singaporensis TaxID=91360 RepID=A0A1H0R8K6_9BACT|nr:tetratricopeptide repeat protein [Desulforhopalus singaporensis]SDP25770.1 Tetratricopeptide repeat-containing protein [Desulforhopalus singaporensis]